MPEELPAATPYPSVDTLIAAIAATASAAAAASVGGQVAQCAVHRWSQDTTSQLPSQHEPAWCSDDGSFSLLRNEDVMRELRQALQLGSSTATTASTGSGQVLAAQPQVPPQQPLPLGSLQSAVLLPGAALCTPPAAPWSQQLQQGPTQQQQQQQCLPPHHHQQQQCVSQQQQYPQQQEQQSLTHQWVQQQQHQHQQQPGLQLEPLHQQLSLSAACVQPLDCGSSNWQASQAAQLLGPASNASYSQLGPVGPTRGPCNAPGSSAGSDWEGQLRSSYQAMLSSVTRRYEAEVRRLRAAQQAALDQKDRQHMEQLAAVQQQVEERAQLLLAAKEAAAGGSAAQLAKELAELKATQAGLQERLQVESEYQLFRQRTALEADMRKLKEGLEQQLRDSQQQLALAQAMVEQQADQLGVAALEQAQLKGEVVFLKERIASQARLLPAQDPSIASLVLPQAPSAAAETAIGSAGSVEAVKAVQAAMAGPAGAAEAVKPVVVVARAAPVCLDEGSRGLHSSKPISPSRCHEAPSKHATPALPRSPPQSPRRPGGQAASPPRPRSPMRCPSPPDRPAAGGLSRYLSRQIREEEARARQKPQQHQQQQQQQQQQAPQQVLQQAPQPQTTEQGQVADTEQVNGEVWAVNGVAKLRSSAELLVAEAVKDKGALSWSTMLQALLDEDQQGGTALPAPLSKSERARAAEPTVCTESSPRRQPSVSPSRRPRSQQVLPPKPLFNLPETPSDPAIPTAKQQLPNRAAGLQCARCGLNDAVSPGECRFHPACVADPGPLLFTPEWIACKAAGHTLPAAGDGRRLGDGDPESRGCYTRREHFYPGRLLLEAGRFAAGERQEPVACSPKPEPRSQLPRPSVRKA